MTLKALSNARRVGSRASRGCSLVFSRLGNLFVAGVLLYLVLAPLGVIQHLLGRDALRLRLDEKARTYWIVHHSPGLSSWTPSVVEVVAFLKKRKKLWLLPIIVPMMVLRITAGRTSRPTTPSPLIYPLH